MKNTTIVLISCLCGLWVSGCSINRFTANTSAGMFGEAAQTFNEESDLAFAQQAMPSNLKMLEGLHKVTPENKTLLTMLAQGYCSYAMAFLEDSSIKEEVERAKSFYLRGYAYGLAALSDDVQKYATGSLEDFGTAVSELDGDDIPTLFWTGQCLGLWVNLNKSDVAAISDLSRAELMMRQVVAKNEKFYQGGAHLFYGTYYGSRPKMLGGNPDTAKKHFDQAIAISQGKFLLAKVYFARFYAITVQDEKLFESTLQEVLAAPVDLLPEERLANQVAKKRAAKLLEQKKDFF